MIKLQQFDLIVKSGGVWTPYDGQRVVGAPIATLVKGRVVMWEGKVTGKPGDGEWAKPVQRNRR